MDWERHKEDKAGSYELIAEWIETGRYAEAPDA
jgi:hypothetical protein